jgi:hypothetical protein
MSGCSWDFGTGRDVYRRRTSFDQLFEAPHNVLQWRVRHLPRLDQDVQHRPIEQLQRFVYGGLHVCWRCIKLKVAPA